MSALCCTGATGLPARAAALTESDAASGMRTALLRSVSAAVEHLGKPNGFLGNPRVRIALPGFLEDAAKLLEVTGQHKRVEELITAMNRAAEAAVPQAKAMLVSAVRSMSVDDALRVVSGDSNSMTQFFAAKTRQPLAARFLPIVTRATEQAALAHKYNAVAARASSLGLVKKEDANLQQYVTGKALDGLYLMIGEEERKIRGNPIATGSAILKRVFGPRP